MRIMQMCHFCSLGDKWQTAFPGNWKTETDLSCVVDEACWMCSPGVSSHLND